MKLYILSYLNMCNYGYKVNHLDYMELVDSDGLVEGTTISASPEELPPGHTRRPCPAVLGAMLHSSPTSGVCSSELTLLLLMKS